MEININRMSMHLYIAFRTRNEIRNFDPTMSIVTYNKKESEYNCLFWFLYHGNNFQITYSCISFKPNWSRPKSFERTRIKWNTKLVFLHMLVSSIFHIIFYKISHTIKISWRRKNRSSISFYSIIKSKPDYTHIQDN